MSPTLQSKEIFERLPAFANPSHYDIHLRPNLTTFDFDGQVSINIEISKPTKFLKLNARDIEFKNVCLQHDGQEYRELPYEINQRWETVIVQLPVEIGVGKATLSLDFKGILDDKMVGFYRSKYTDSAGKDVYMAATQFEPIYARRAFPCWDEPAYKATFDCSLTVPKEKVALCNTDAISETVHDDGTKTLKYRTSPLMSTYLVAFVVGDFEYVERYTKRDNIRLRAYTLVGNKEQTELALDVAVSSLDHYGEFFAHPYVMKKCDFVAIPDFKMGAMENWGLVTFREVCLLCDPKVTSPFRTIHVCITTAHELAHMWFGNLVTMEWWTDLWLNEGYATFMSYWLLAFAKPELRAFDKFAQEHTLLAMERDALLNSHPVEVPIEDPEQIQEIFDVISYRKSSSLLYMLYTYLGEQVFRDSMRRYIAKWQYKNTQTADLWAAFSETSGQDISALMNSWVQQMGFPLISVSRSEENGQTLLVLKQRRFLSDGSEELVSLLDKSKPLWIVPVTVTSQSKRGQIAARFEMKEAEVRISLKDILPSEWIKLNPNLTGFYRVQYSDEMLLQLQKAISDGQLSCLDRLNLVSDIFALVVSGAVSATQFLSLSARLVSESEKTVWVEIGSGLGALRNVLKHSSIIMPQFDTFLRQLFAKIASTVGWDAKSDESLTNAELRTHVFVNLVKAGDEKVIAESKTRFAKYAAALLEKGDETLLAPEIRRPVFQAVATHNGQEAFDTLLKVYSATKNAEVRNHCLVCMSFAVDPKVVDQFLKFLMSDKVRNQDLIYAFVGFSSTVFSQKKAWTFFKENFDSIFTRCGSSFTDHIFTNVFKTCCGNMSTDEELKDVETFFSKFDSVAFARPLNQVLESIRLNIELFNRNEKAVKEWLEARS